MRSSAATAAVNAGSPPLICVRPPGMASRICGALTTYGIAAIEANLNRIKNVAKRIDSVFGDRHLVCSCPSPEAFED